MVMLPSPPLLYSRIEDSDPLLLLLLIFDGASLLPLLYSTHTPSEAIVNRTPTHPTGFLFGYDYVRVCTIFLFVLAPPPLFDIVQLLCVCVCALCKPAELK